MQDSLLLLLLSSTAVLLLVIVAEEEIAAVLVIATGSIDVVAVVGSTTPRVTEVSVFSVLIFF